ncbi:FAD-binding protein, partial [Nocardioides hankookensis]
AGPRGIVARGLGRSYGDAAQNAGGVVVAPLESWIEPDLERPGGPVVEVSAGASLHDLMGRLLPTGHFVPVTPGTRYVTVGGAIAADVHGKSHHRDGSFGDHVVSLDLLTADGSTRTLGPDSQEFWATVGGMGLTGVVTRATVRVRPVDSAYLKVDTERLPDLPSLMRRMREADRASTYSVAWIDTVSGGRSLGRSILTVGEHATLDDLGPRLRERRWQPPHPPRATVPGSPVNLVTRLSSRAFSELWYRKAPAHREGEIQSIAAFFHPLDGVGSWNRVYGGAGFVQYQLVVPDAAEDALPALFERLVRGGLSSFLSVLKRFGPANRGLLSFPMTGWTLAIDVPTSAAVAAGPLLAELDREVADLGGRVYLAKDSRLDPEVFALMYPRLEEFREVKAALDPDGVFQSDLARRLRIVVEGEQ